MQVSGWRKQLDAAQEKPETYVVSQYLDQPLLLGGRKFDLRIYVLVLSYAPLVVYLHRLAAAQLNRAVCTPPWVELCTGLFALGSSVSTLCMYAQLVTSRFGHHHEASFAVHAYMCDLSA